MHALAGIDSLQNAHSGRGWLAMILLLSFVLCIPLTPSMFGARTSHFTYRFKRGFCQQQTII